MFQNTARPAPAAPPTSDPATHIRWRRWVVPSLVVAGALLRLTQYARNRSLWLDEASLACNFLDRSWLDLLQPLDFSQAAPIGFLLGTKIITGWFGVAEWSLRLIPLAAGLTILPLFALLAGHWLGRAGALFAITLVVISHSLIYYSSEFKPYILDVLLAIATLLAFRPLVEGKPAGRSSYLAMGATALAAPWLSFPAIFILASVLTVGFARAALSRSFSLFRDVGSMSVIGGMSFALNFFVFARRNFAIPGMHDYWAGRNAFMPLPPASGNDLSWFTTQVFGYFEHVGGLHSSRNLVLALAVIGICCLVRRRNYGIVAACGTPLLLAGLASGLHLYPFQGRLLLFSIPGMFLLVGAGIDAVYETARAARYVSVPIVAIALFSPTAYSISAFARGIEVEETRPLVRRLAKKNGEQTEQVVVLGAASPYLYYARRFSAPPATVWRPGSDLPTVAFNHQNTSIWLLVSHVEASTEANALNLLAGAGWQTETTLRTTGAALFKLKRLPRG